MVLLAWMVACAPPLLSPDTGCPPRSGWVDADGDGHGDPHRPLLACALQADWSGVGDDCDDADADRFPGQAEVCDGVDQDCSGVADDGLPMREYWPDDDGDGFGGARVGPIRRCFPPPGHVTNGLDCDDTDPERFPGGPRGC